MGLDTDVFGGRFARGVRTQRKKRGVLVDREVFERDAAVGVGGQHGNDAAHSRGVRRREYVRRAFDVGTVRLDGIAPRSMDIALPRQVIDDFGLVVEHVLLDRLRVGDVGPAAGSIGGDHRVALCLQVRDQMPADEPGCASDEGLHEVAIRWYRSIIPRVMSAHEYLTMRERPRATRSSRTAGS